VKAILVVGFVMNVGYLISQVPTPALVVFVLCVSVMAFLVLINESACDRLIRILKVLLGRSDNTQKQKRR